MVFCGLFPIDSDQLPGPARRAREADAQRRRAVWEPETSDALGFGFRCGFLGLLHMDIVRERLEREYDLELLATMPSVEFEVTLDRRRACSRSTTRPTCPTRRAIEEVARALHPRARSSRRRSTSGTIMELCQERRGEHAGMHYLSRRARADHLRPAAGRDRARLLRPAEVAHARLRVARLRARSACSASDLVKLDVLLAGDPVDALSMVVHRDKAYDGRPRRWPRSCARRSRASSTTCRSRPRSARTIIARETVKAVPQGRDRQVLRRRHHAQAQAAREAEGGQEADEAGRPHRGPAGGVPGRARARRRLGPVGRGAPGPASGPRHLVLRRLDGRRDARVAVGWPAAAGRPASRRRRPGSPGRPAATGGSGARRLRASRSAGRRARPAWRSGPAWRSARAWPSAPGCGRLGGGAPVGSGDGAAASASGRGRAVGSPGGWRPTGARARAA